MGYVLAAIIAGIFSLLVVFMQNRANRALAKGVTAVHEEVRTNHGIRQGQRIEDIGDSLEQIKRTMVTKVEFTEHTEQDKEHFAEVRNLINSMEK